MPSDPPRTGDLNAEEFRRQAHRLADWIADYLADPGRYPVLARVAPGAIRDALPDRAPERPEPLDEVLDDFERILLPGVTHWNHPGFLAYFASSAGAPGILADFLASALNQQAMLWRTSPVATELEEVTLGWLRRLLKLPDTFEGVIYDTASISTLHALAAAREARVPEVREQGLAGRHDLPPLGLYCSGQAHSSIDKAVVMLGLGLSAIRRVETDAEYRMRPDSLERAIAGDRAAGRLPLAVVATIGTTSSTSADPVPAVADVCDRHGVWLHVDAAYAGVAAMVPGFEGAFAGCDRADSFVVNPHKWLFTPFDLSVLYTPRMDVVRRSLSLTPEYLRTPEAGVARNLMDTGIQLGRRFRAIKLWMTLRAFGASGIRERLAEHIRLARLFARWVDDHPDFERIAPVPFSTVCFRCRPAGRPWTEAELETLNARLLDRVNASGEIFISHTSLDGRYVLRVSVGNLRTEERHVRRAWELLSEEAARLH